jgi:hypothetical protein
MNRLESLTARFCTTLGVALLAVSVLVVPEKAFADAASDCSVACCEGCFSTDTCDTLSSCWTNCQGLCTVCESACGSDTTCQAMCLTTARDSQCPNGTGGVDTPRPSPARDGSLRDVS